MSPSEAILIILALVAIEGLLSADNAMILAVMVRPLPKEQRRKALLYGIFGAYALRGLMILFATYLIQLWWVQLAGGGYLLYLAIRHMVFRKEAMAHEPAATLPGDGSRGFWTTVVKVEALDLAFAVDSALVAVAFTNTLWVIYAGVFAGILALRLAAGWFVGLLDRYPRFELVAYALVGWAGVKLTLEGWSNFALDALGRGDLALHLPKWAFWVVTVSILGSGAFWATRRSRGTIGKGDAALPASGASTPESASSHEPTP